MRRTALSLTIVPLLLLACSHAPVATDPSTAPAPSAATTASTADAAFAQLAKRWLDDSMALSPVSATQIGDHRFDAELDDLSLAGRERALAFAKAMRAELDRIAIAELSRENQVDALILRNQLDGDIFTLDTLQSWAWDPQIYNGLAGSAIYGLMAREFAPMPQRLRAATARMEKIPALFAQARANLDPARVPAVHAQTVAKQNAGLISLIDTFIVPNAGRLQGAERARLDAAVDGLRKAVAEQQTWLDTVLVPKAKGDFRLGQRLYDEKLRLSLNSGLSRADIRQRADAELRRVRERMYVLATQILRGTPKAPALPATPTPAQQQAAIEAALERAYAERPARDQVVAMAKQTLQQATDFARSKDLLTVPDTPVNIILMPEFQRGVAVAYCDSPGPLDKHLDTYYAISPIPDDWTDAQTDSFLREYNTRMIHLLSIHEGVPGHYLEGAHSANHPSLLRAVLRSGPFAEGWAVYTERMMQQAGYLDGDPLFELVQLKFYLRSIANAILDQGVHVDGWSREQAMQLMVHDTFQQEREAAGKWTRAQLTSAQLPSYFVGVQEHLDTEQAMRQRLGARFDAKTYHDRMLSFGAPPVRFARQLLLDQPIR
ncbi:MAG: DUF885 domain-containing protein [Pseudoxanthomonas suwonensis]|nr:MAG: DUF885 domain-containing protein [Pseudoxanthomonas suwonensis]